MRPKFRPGQTVISYGFAPFIVERVYFVNGEYLYDLREVLSPLLLTLTKPEPTRGVPERFVHAVEE